MAKTRYVAKDANTASTVVARKLTGTVNAFQATYDARSKKKISQGEVYSSEDVGHGLTWESSTQPAFAGPNSTEKFVFRILEDDSAAETEGVEVGRIEVEISTKVFGARGVTGLSGIITECHEIARGLLAYNNAGTAYSFADAVVDRQLVLIARQ